MPQLVNRPALQALSQFVREPTPFNASRLVHIPSVYDVLQYHDLRREPYPNDLVSLCKWIFDRGQAALKALISHTAPPLDRTASEMDNKWRTVIVIPWQSPQTSDAS